MATGTTEEAVTSPARRDGGGDGGGGGDDNGGGKRHFKFPTAFTVLFFVLLLVWGLTFVVKPGAYAYVNCDGSSAKWDDGRSSCCAPTRSTPRPWRSPGTGTRSSCTASRRSTTRAPRWARTSRTGTAWTRWR